MKLKKLAVTISLFLLAVNLFAANDIALLERSKNSGMTIYWDSLSETGMQKKTVISFHSEMEKGLFFQTASA